MRGQVIIILLLVMVVALALGLSVIGHTISDISTSTRVEDSARAYLAAEAGIEKAISSTENSGPLPIPLTNNSSATVNWTRTLPPTGIALEFPPIGKESFAHFWLANPDNLASYYGSASQGKADDFELYFGVAKDYTSDIYNQPAVEVHVITVRGSTYESKKFYYDSFNGSAPGRDNNGFNGCSSRESNGVKIPTNSYSGTRSFYCKAIVPYRSAADKNNIDPVLVRVRILYSNLSHPVAIKPTSGSLPPQASVYNSTGIAGNTQRDLQVFQQKSVVPYMFDYVLFSSGQVTK
ncbi:hypothetical protein A3C32_02955 [Candidatus Daviesbacteria bacterium RIFCSPHIGHO2_02_FULL_41_14]|uniref:Type 4 fimbrial biogenesis protein PilX N-terminal domain-containing protein n=1 Tax=Candidatus Daviesbacteria bacterium RIFCSPLOWO2_01_FULL_40_24 TaxID=1797787 RepID=A0A1F5MIT1_9BACT|nr:MAG: hypothetical protein A2780_03515 [Candidatus Daviesbacteria bacterium RIFCSPHIGHO2_01_FULL_41_45]OGE35537.1 MAG: hypothetical protein A3C32_02955 [Candidatus Daviesbacteria bacterium RIFCSPHIGHO2_02_FULL_41_14]OGE65286.1 MAG: hypothetical protein A3B49_00290 [Candidatus Daviesbacteria bacterium RIFCSPLOWO2_01_FULL_40_24]